MKIALIGKFAMYNAEYFYSKAFRKMGHDVEFFDQYSGINHSTIHRYIQSRSKIFHFLMSQYDINKDIVTTLHRYDPDLIIVFKGEFLSTRTLEELSRNFKIVLFWPDTYKFIPSIAGRIQFFETLITASNNLDFYYRLGARRALTVPWACDPEFHRYLNMDPKYKISFVGTAYLERRRILKQIRDANVFGDYWFGFGLRHQAVIGEEYVKTINSSRINLNLQARISIMADAPTMRTFEIAGCRSFQISDHMPSLKTYFPEIVTFKTLDELKDLIAYYINAESERNEISNKLQERCYKHFTYFLTAKRILEKV